MATPAISLAAENILAQSQIMAAAMNSGGAVVVEGMKMIDSKMNILLRVVMDQVQQDQFLQQLAQLDPAAQQIMIQLKTAQSVL